MLLLRYGFAFLYSTGPYSSGCLHICDIFLAVEYFIAFFDALCIMNHDMLIHLTSRESIYILVLAAIVFDGYFACFTVVILYAEEWSKVSRHTSVLELVAAVFCLEILDQDFSPHRTL